MIPHQFLKIMEMLAQNTLLPSCWDPHRQGFDTCASRPRGCTDHSSAMYGQAAVLRCELGCSHSLRHIQVLVQSRDFAA